MHSEFQWKKRELKESCHKSDSLSLILWRKTRMITLIHAKEGSVNMSKRSSTPRSLHNLAPILLLASLSLSLSILRRILPDGLLGIDSTNCTPPFNHVCRDLCCSTGFWMSRMSIWSVSSRPTDADFTTKAFGSSAAALWYGLPLEEVTTPMSQTRYRLQD